MKEYSIAEAWEFIRNKWDDPRISEMAGYADAKSMTAKKLKEREDWADISQAANNRHRELHRLKPYPMPKRKTHTRIIVTWPREE